LREEAYAVDVAAAGDDGLYKAESYDYDAIVLDIMLPVSMAGKCWSACASKSQLLC
jgi:DNA-binding response OmpR family regulator